MVNGKSVVRDLQVYELHSDGSAHNWYIDEEGYKVSSRTSEHGRYLYPQWLPIQRNRNDRCQDCRDWRHRRCGQNIKQPVCNLCGGLHLDRECPRGTGSREELVRRKREIERLIEEEKKMGIFRAVEEEMDSRYAPGGKQDQRKVQTGTGNRGTAPTHELNDE